MAANRSPERAVSLDRLTITLRWIAVGALLLGTVAVLADVLLLVFAAVLIAALLDGAAGWAALRTGIGRNWWVLAIVLALVAAVGLLGWWRGSEIVQEVGDLWSQLLARVQSVTDRMDDSGWGRRLEDRIRSWLTGDGSHAAGMVVGVVSTTIGGLGSLLLMAATALYLAVAPRTYVSGMLLLLPPPWRDRGRSVLLSMGQTLRWWFIGQFCDMLVVGGLSWSGLALLGVPLAGTLALIAGVCNFVPYVGALAGAVPAVLVAFGQGPEQALYVAAMFLVVQTLEGNVIAPLVQRRAGTLPPVVTILSQVVFGTLFGILGLILATPLAAAGLVAVRMVYVGDVLGDRTAET